MNLSTLSSVAIGVSIDDYDSFITNFEKQLSDTKVKYPIQIEILNQNEAYDRCTYLFSSYDTYCYDKGNDRLIMNIYYYRFQKDFFTLYRRITEETILEYEKYAALTEKMSAALMARKNSQIHSLIILSCHTP